MADLTPQERTILDWLAAQRPAMLALLEALVNTDSGSYDKRGVDAVGARLRGFLETHAIAHDVIPDDRFGDAVRASVGIAIRCFRRARRRAGHSGSRANGPMARALPT